MAGSVNKVILVGRLGRAPELKFIPSGQAVCSFSIATSENYSKDGEKQEKTEWHNCVLWGKSAENYLAKFAKPGDLLSVIGKLQTRTWDDKEGKKQYRTEVVADMIGGVQILHSKEGFGDRGGDTGGHEDRGGGRGGDGGGYGASGRQASSRGASGPSGQQRMAQAAPAEDMTGDFGGGEDDIPF